MLNKEQIDNREGQKVSPVSLHYLKILADGISLALKKNNFTVQEGYALRRAEQILTQHAAEKK